MSAGPQSVGATSQGYALATQAARPEYALASGAPRTPGTPGAPFYDLGAAKEGLTYSVPAGITGRPYDLASAVEGQYAIPYNVNTESSYVSFSPNAPKQNNRPPLEINYSPKTMARLRTGVQNPLYERVYNIAPETLVKPKKTNNINTKLNYLNNLTKQKTYSTRYTTTNKKKKKKKKLSKKLNQIITIEEAFNKLKLSNPNYSPNKQPYEMSKQERKKTIKNLQKQLNNAEKKVVAQSLEY